MFHLNGFNQVIHVYETTAGFDSSLIIRIHSTLLLHRQKLCDGLDLANCQSTLERLVKLCSFDVPASQVTKIYTF